MNCTVQVVIMNLATVCCILVFLPSFIHAQTCQPPECFVNGTREILCNTCPIGHGVAIKDKDFLHCQSSPTARNTKCEPCVAGVNFSDTNDPETKCSSCRKCVPVKEVTKEECTRISDRVCQCSEGYFENKNLGSCVNCTTCGQHEKEISPCTPSENRKCGPRPTSERPVTTDHSSTTPSAIYGINPTPSTPVDPVVPDLDTSTKDPTEGSFPAWAIVLTVFSIALIIALIFVIKFCRGNKKNTDGNGSFTFNCCIGNQTNTFDQTKKDATQIPMNGTEPKYQQVPNGQGPLPNGNVIQPNLVATPSNTSEREPLHQSGATMDDTGNHLSPTEAAEFLGLSATQFNAVITGLEMRDEANRNAYMLCEKHLGMPLESSSTPGKDVLILWAKQRRTKKQLKEALIDMDRGDVANEIDS